MKKSDVAKKMHGDREDNFIYKKYGKVTPSLISQERYSRHINGKKQLFKKTKGEGSVLMPKGEKSEGETMNINPKTGNQRA